MCRVPRDQFFQFSWRPRAPTLLTKEQQDEISKHLKDYSKRYDEIDSKLLQEVRYHARRTNMLGSTTHPACSEPCPMHGWKFARLMLWARKSCVPWHAYSSQLSAGGRWRSASLRVHGWRLQTDVAIVAERQRMKEEWQEWYQTKEDWLSWHQAKLEDLLGERLEEGEYTTEEVTVETVIANTEEILKT